MIATASRAALLAEARRFGIPGYSRLSLADLRAAVQQAMDAYRARLARAGVAA
jgi:hypothetical protein